jgi:predicted enzyme related to lactoylglutathione lyase
MEKVTGIGGVFFKTRDPAALTDWYVRNLGLPVDDEGFVVIWWGGANNGSTVWGPFPEETNDFHWPDDKQWMINYRVNDLDAMLKQLKASGVDASDDVFEDVNGRFGHCWDPEGNRIQLWQPHPGM